MKKFVLSYTFAIALAEFLGIILHPVYGVFVHVVLITALLSYSALKPTAPYRRLLPALLLAPLVRILSFVMPIQDAPQVYWYALVGTPLLLAAALTARYLRLTRAQIGLYVRDRRQQGLIGLSGIPLGIAAVAILRPAPLLGDFDWLTILTIAVAVVIFTAFVEEFLYRGILQPVLSESLGEQAGMLLSSGIFVIMYLATQSFSYIFFIGLVGLYFSYCAQKTGSIWGITLAHTLMNLGMIILWPMIQGMR